MVDGKTMKFYMLPPNPDFPETQEWGSTGQVGKPVGGI